MNQLISFDSFSSSEVNEIRQKMDALMNTHNLPSFNFNEKSSIPSRSVLLTACISLTGILESLIKGEDKNATNAFCAMVSSYANKVDYCLSSFHRLSPPLSVAYRPLNIRIAWYAELANSPAFQKQ